MDYTLDELVAAVACRLTASGLDRQVNGQVSAFPDRRTLRYYTTIGLMDRPDAVRDRQARYSDRHVAQAVAVKRLQSSGLALAAVQGRLAGLPPSEVEAIAAGAASGPPGGAEGRRFWAEAPAEAGRATDVVPQRVENPSPSPDNGARPLLAVALSPDVTLLLAGAGPMAPEDIGAIRRAATPLLEQLAHLPAAAHSGAERDRKDHR